MPVVRGCALCTHMLHHAPHAACCVPCNMSTGFGALPCRGNGNVPPLKIRQLWSIDSSAAGLLSANYACTHICALLITHAHVLQQAYPTLGLCCVGLCWHSTQGPTERRKQTRRIANIYMHCYSYVTRVPVGTVRAGPGKDRSILYLFIYFTTHTDCSLKVHGLCKCPSITLSRDITHAA